MNISLDQYKLFYFVGKHLNFSLAAQDLCITQSAVSQGIKTLEKQSGCLLFHRTTKQVSFTKEGSLLYAHIAQAYQIIDDGESILQELTHRKAQELSIAASDTLCRHVLLPYLQEWHNRYPHIHLKITNRPSAACVNLVLHGNVQIGLVNLYPELQENNKLTIRPLRTVHDCFVGGPHFTGLANSPQPLAAILNFPLLLLEQGAISRQYFNRFISPSTRQPDIELGSLDVMMDLVKINLGLSFVPREYIRSDLIAGNCIEIPLQKPIPARDIGWITSNQYPSRQSLRLLLTLITADPI